METDGHHALLSAAIESQPDLSDGRNVAGHRSLDLDADAPGSFDVDGTELMVEEAACLELPLVPAGFVRVVENVLLIAFTRELEFAGHQE